jgi:invasion protein IalB
MKLTVAALFVVVVLAIHGPGGAARAQQKPEHAAEKAAGAWLALVDPGNYAKSWEEAAQYFKGAVSKQE